MVFFFDIFQNKTKQNKTTKQQNITKQNKTHLFFLKWCKDPQLYKKLFVTNIPGDISKEYFVQLIQPYAKNGKIIETKFFKRVVSGSIILIFLLNFVVFG